LTNTGSSNIPAWAQVALATGVSGTLPVGNGGTGATTFTANGILVGNGSSAMAVTATMATKGHLMAGDGSGVPSMLAVGGTNDHVLTVDSGEATGIKWAAVSAGTLPTLLEDWIEDETKQYLFWLGPITEGSKADNAFVGFGQSFRIHIESTGTVAASTTFRGGWVLTTAAADNDVVVIYGGGASLSAAGDWTIIARINHTSGNHDYIGLTANPEANNGPDSNNDWIGVGIDSGNQFFTVCDSGGTETRTGGTTSVTGVVTIRLEITAGGTSVQGFLNDVAEDIITTNIPSSTALSVCMGIRSIGSAADPFNISDFIAFGDA